MRGTRSAGLVSTASVLGVGGNGMQLLGLLHMGVLSVNVCVQA